MKKSWFTAITTLVIVFFANVLTNDAYAKTKTAIEQTHYEKYYFSAMIICLVLAIFTFFFRAKKYKERK